MTCDHERWFFFGGQTCVCWFTDRQQEEKQKSCREIASQTRFSFMSFESVRAFAAATQRSTKKNVDATLSACRDNTISSCIRPIAIFLAWSRMPYKLSNYFLSLFYDSPQRLLDRTRRHSNLVPAKREGIHRIFEPALLLLENFLQKHGKITLSFLFCLLLCDGKQEANATENKKHWKWIWSAMQNRHNERLNRNNQH